MRFLPKIYRLLIVDDEKDICENLRLLVDRQQYQISSILTATSYEDAIAKAVDFQPHIALVDVSLNGHWGYELVEYLRSLGLTTSFCMISGYDDFSYVQRSMKAGAKNYLLKPVDVCELKAYLENVVVNELHGSVAQSALSHREIDPILQREYRSLSKITNKIILITKSNYRNSISLTSIAEMFHMSSKYIGRVFLKDTGMKFSEYLMAYRMTIAKQMIENSQEKISFIAMSVGYPQLNNFYIHFKSYFHFSPGALRNFSSAEEQQAEKDSAEMLSQEGGELSCDENYGGTL